MFGNLFNKSPRATKEDIEYVDRLLYTLNESANLVNTTVNPQVFWQRLNFVLDILLELQKYEKYNMFIGNPPSEDFNKTIDKLEYAVNDFLDRATENEFQKISVLKTEKAKNDRAEKFVIAIMTSFEMANTFWSGNNKFPHYTGPLFVANSINYFYDLIEIKLELYRLTNIDLTDTWSVFNT
ncbi:MAG: hypothetical protein RSF40_10940 [Oscillospiraceae bacterium]